MKRMSVYIIKILMSRMDETDKLLSILQLFADIDNPLAMSLLGIVDTMQTHEQQSVEITPNSVTYTFKKW